MGIFTNRIKQLRKNLKITQAELAKQVGIAVSYMTMIENGDRDMDTTLMRKIAKALNVKPYELLPEEEQPEILSEEEKAILALFRKSKANNNPPAPAKAE